MRSTIILAAAILIGLSSPTVVSAGECPEEHRLTEARTLEKMPGKGVKPVVRERINLTGWRDMGNFRLRMRHFTIAPGGTVANHNHGDRPATIYFVSGEIYEHNALCAEPILHKPGETTSEFGADQTHWWENRGEEPVILISNDVVPFKP
ncbi:MAG: cupin domain-containing protein [Pseudomonadota bacterium]